MDPETSERNADAAHGVRSREGRWTPGGCGDFPKAIRKLFLVAHGGSRDRNRQAMSTLHGLEDGCENPVTTGKRECTGRDLVSFCILTLEGVLRVEHRFAVANSPWSNVARSGG